MTATGPTDSPAGRYLDLCRRLLDPATDRLRVPADCSPAFWERCAAGRSLPVETVPASGQAFPEPTGRVAFWRSTGIASAYTELRVGHLEPAVLGFDEAFDGVAAGLRRYRALGPRPLVLAVLSAHLGMSCAYLGTTGSATGADALDGAAFVPLWNEFHPRHRLRTVCAGLGRDRLLAALPAGRERTLSSCDRRTEGWCGDCPACFQAYYTAKAVHRPLGFRLSQRIFDDLYTHRYRAYLASEFDTGPGGGHGGLLPALAQLQMTHGLRFEQDLDVAPEARQPEGAEMTASPSRRSVRGAAR